ncbi:MAG: hypothetical protein HY049_10490, partial [Acidobacteria bacterium]|nr:hypothetical protein [Acidobacteriota bacterium]
MLRAAARAGATIICLLAAVTVPPARAADAGAAAGADAEAEIRELKARLAELEAAVKAQASPAGAVSLAEIERRIDLLAAELERLRLGE